MSPRNPPRIATWMMEHMTPTGRDEAIAGDLLEEYRAGRSAGWYWLQVIAAIAVEWSRKVWQLRAALLFAAMWSFLSPAWMLLYFRIWRHSSIIGVIWRIPWPWSTVCDLALRAAVNMLFIWLGVLLYIVLCRIAFGVMQPGRYGLAFFASIVAYAVTSTCEIAIALSTSPHSNGPGVDWQTLTLIGAVENLSVWTPFVRLPYFVGMAGALWFLSPKAEPPRGLAA